MLSKFNTGLGISVLVLTAGTLLLGIYLQIKQVRAIDKMFM